MDHHRMKLRPRKTKPQTQQGKNTRKKNSNNSRVVLPHIHEDLVIQEILSRLPVRSLMRFKCVSKRWESTIRDDSRFIELHLSHSKKRPCHSLLVVPQVKKYMGTAGNKMECYLTSSLSFEEKDEQLTMMHNLSKKESEFLTFDDIIGPVNGLFGIVENSISTVTIYNFYTRELVEECSKPTLLASLRSGYFLPPVLQTYFFGFDSTSKKYKVISFWRLGAIQDRAACEVFTLGGNDNNTWRNIDEELPPCCFEELSCYANDSIYWRSSVEELRGLPQPYPEHLAKIDASTDQVLVAFDLGSEKFRVIPIPNFVPPRDSYFQLVHPEGNRVRLYPDILEIGGRVVLSYRSNSENIELFLFEDDCDNKAIANTTGNMMRNWTKESIELPIVLNNGVVDIYPLPDQSDYVLLICSSGHATMKTPTFYSYNIKKKTFKMIMFDEWGSDFHHPYMYATIVESLSPFGV